MVKTQVLVRRKDGISREEFADYWLRVHVPITSKLPGLSRQTVSLVRSDLQRAECQWDGLANAWWQDTQSLAHLRDTDAYQAMLEDEKVFVDVSARGPLIVEEFIPPATAVPPPATPDAVKIVNPLRRKAGMSYDSFSAYWRGPHAQLNCDLPFMLAYVQNHLRGDYITGSEAADGIAESWFASWDDVLKLIQSKQFATLRADEPNLIDQGSVRPMICREVETFRT